MSHQPLIAAGSRYGSFERGSSASSDRSATQWTSMSTYAQSRYSPIDTDKISVCIRQKRSSSHTSLSGNSSAQPHHSNQTTMVAPSNQTTVVAPHGTRSKASLTVSDAVGRPRTRSSYIGEIVWSVGDHVYMGGMRAARNENLLCRLGIEYIIDVSNVEMPMSKIEMPCTCSKETRHSRAIMQINVSPDDSTDVTVFFAEVNQFIEKAKRANKCVLIHSEDGTNRAAVFAIQYLIVKHRIGHVQATKHLREHSGATISISANFVQSLRYWSATMVNRVDFDHTSFSTARSKRIGSNNSMETDGVKQQLRSMAHAFTRASSYSNIPQRRHRTTAWY